MLCAIVIESNNITLSFSMNRPISIIKILAIINSITQRSLGCDDFSI
jgi:hypothetical protein